MRSTLFAIALYASAYLLMLGLPLIADAQGPSDDHQTHLHADALIPPPPTSATTRSTDQTRGPSQFLAGNVAVRVILPESDGTVDPSTENWTPAQIAAVTNDIQAALDWWAAQLPLAHLRFSLNIEVVPTAFEPITRDLRNEGKWIGDVLTKKGYTGNYFDQAYALAHDTRNEQRSDWATTIFVVNSANDNDGRFSDGRFAYAYINGPFMVLTSDVGAYGDTQLAAIAAHEFGHIFGALDQYSEAQTPCTRSSGYLDVPTRNSQFNQCGTRAPSIMLEPVSAYHDKQIDASAREQVGYRDSDSDSVIDPLDTTPTLELFATTNAVNQRPVVRGQSSDSAFPAPFHKAVTINKVAQVEYRVDGGEWQAATADDGAFDSSNELFSAQLPLYDGHHDVEFRAVNNQGIQSASQTLSIQVENVGQQPDYAVHTADMHTSPLLELHLDAPATTQAVQISEGPAFTGAAWQPYHDVMTYQLAAGADGQRTIYARFRDAAGLESLAVAQKIVLDTTPPEGWAKLKRETDTRLQIHALDEVSGIAAVEVQIDGTAMNWQTYQEEIALPSDATQVYVRVRDGAGNTSPAFAAQDQQMLYLPALVNP